MGINATRLAAASGRQATEENQAKKDGDHQAANRVVAEAQAGARTSTTG